MPHESDIPVVLQIPPVAMVFKPYRGPAQEFSTINSVAIFARLYSAARHAHRVISATLDGRVLDAESRGALNSYLRTKRLGRGGAFPFHRQDYSCVATRYQWEVFCRYLDFTFIP